MASLAVAVFVREETMRVDEKLYVRYVCVRVLVMCISWSVCRIYTIVSVYRHSDIMDISTDSTVKGHSRQYNILYVVKETKEKTE